MIIEKYKFPYLALFLGAGTLLLVLGGSITDSNGETRIPLLTLLIISEFAFIITAVGVFLGGQHMRSHGSILYKLTTAGCAIVSISAMYMGIKLWPL